MKHAWIMGLVLLVWPIGSVGLQRGLVLIEDPSGRPVRLYQDSYALVVGVSRYRNGWPSLPGVPEDVRKVQATLKDHDFHVTLVEDPDHEQLQRAFTAFITAHGGTPDNRLLFYFAGHGATLEQAYGGEMGYIVPADAPLPDADRDGFRARALDMRLFDFFARQIQSKHALFLFDSCFSGSIFALSRAVPMNISYKTARPVRQFITSGSKDETVPDKSIFREQFLVALAGEGDTNSDGYVSGTELGEFLQGKVVDYSYGAQHPQYGKIRDPRLDKGDFVFALADPPPPPPVQPSPPPPPPPPVRRQGNVQINVNVPATVYINDMHVGEAKPETPLNHQGVTVGRAEIRVEAPGFKSATQWAQIKRGEWTQLVFDFEQSTSQVKVEPTSEGESPLSKWVVHVATTLRERNAMQLRDQLREAGFAAQVESVSVRIGTGGFEVLVGPYLDRDQAESIKDQLENRYQLTGKVKELLQVKHAVTNE